jgi:hypothetical protein
MNKRDLLADLEAIREGATLFGDPNPGVNTQYELYEVAEHAIERAIKVEALARELVDMLGRVTPCYTEGRLGIDLDAVYEVNRLLKKAKEVLGIVRVKKHGSRLKKGGGCGEL